MHGLILQSPGAVFFSIGPITLRWYGIMIALGFLSATFAVTKLARRWGIDGDKVVNLMLTCFIGGIIGARLYFVALSWGYFSLHPTEILMTWSEGFSIRGLSIHGGMIGSIIAGILYCRHAKLPFWTCCDMMAAVVPLAQAIGRWGNFFNSEAFGKPVPADFPIKLFIPRSSRPPFYISADFFHPTFLYESMWDLWLFGLLYFALSDRFKKYPGLLFFTYLAVYSLGRFLIEPLRTDSIMVGGMAAPEVVSAGLIVIGTIGAIVMWKRPRTVPDTAASAETEQTELKPADKSEA